MELQTPYRDDVELRSLREPIDDPDAPLPFYSGEVRPRERPRWMLGGPTATRWHRILKRSTLRPRLSWRYILCVLILLYVLWCLVRRSPLFASKLPPYSGPFGVGIVDLEIAVDTPRNISESILETTGKPVFALETALFSLYYPTLPGVRSNRQSHTWIAKPIGATAEGYARAAHVNNFIMRPVFTFALWLIAGGIYIPAEVDVPVAEDRGDKFPVIVFSHGTASSRTDYTHFCGEMASRGVVLAAIEHRDGSGPASLVFGRNGEERRVMYLRESDLRADPLLDAAKFKEEQLAFREAEIEEVIRVLQRVNAGQGDDVFKANFRNEGHGLQDWAEKLDLEKLVIAGHSYGATGALQALKGAPQSQSRPARGGIILDPGKSSGPLNHDIDVPILVIHSNSWSRQHSIFFGRPHFDTVRDLVGDVLTRVGASWFITSLETSHPSVTDAPLIEPLLLRWTTGATINAKEGLREYVQVSMEFLEFISNSTRKGVLAQPVTHPKYGVDERTEEQRKSQPTDISKYWQIHVAPSLAE
ncbi:PAF-acetylhydrolase family member [Coleophoma crateriformis]|uniref:Putative phospholipase n=1 Tax=Coleophoma crateriformis TaxID=565419 RepID=A0A3D8Q5Y3_9HELO|nr:PAF-acetylhydrolase family member [Coleophoma crateriformis]